MLLKKLVNLVLDMRINKNLPFQKLKPRTLGINNGQLNLILIFLDHKVEHKSIFQEHLSQSP